MYYHFVYEKAGNSAQLHLPHVSVLYNLVKHTDAVSKLDRSSPSPELPIAE